MKKIILHVGSGKAGSSSIQNALAKCFSLNKIGFMFPALAGSKSNQTFRFGFCRLNETTINVRRRFSDDRDFVEFGSYQNELRKSFLSQVEGSSTVVVSSEYLFLSSAEEVGRINEYLRGVGFTEIHVIMYLRDPAKYYLSVAQQALKNQYKMPSPDGFRLDMCSAIENWSSINPSSLTVKEFNTSLLDGGNVIIDFQGYLASIGVDADLDSTIMSNGTLSVEATQVLQNYYLEVQQDGKAIRENSESVRRARQFIRKNPIGTKPILKNVFVERIYRRFKDEILEINDGYGLFNELKGQIDMTCEKSTEILLGVEKFKDIVVDFDDDVFAAMVEQM